MDVCVCVCGAQVGIYIEWANQTPNDCRAAKRNARMHPSYLRRAHGRPQSRPRSFRRGGAAGAEQGGQRLLHQQPRPAARHARQCGDEGAGGGALCLL